MKNASREERQKFLYLFCGITISLALLAVLGALRVNYPVFTSIEAHWVVLGATPLFLSLLLGGFVSSLGAFGVELKATLNKSIDNVWDELSTSQSLGVLSLDAQRVVGKGAIENLDKLSFEQRKRIRFLRFQVELQQQYQANAIFDYFRRLPNLEYIEVVRQDKLVAIIPLSHFFATTIGIFGKSETEVTIGQQIERFIEYLVDADDYFLDLPKEFEDVSTRVTEKTTIRDLTGIMTIGAPRVFSVVSRNGTYLGSLLPSEISLLINRSAES